MENGTVFIPAGLKRGANRRLAGEDLAEGATVVLPGQRLRAQRCSGTCLNRDCQYYLFQETTYLLFFAPAMRYSHQELPSRRAKFTIQMGLCFLVSLLRSISRSHIAAFFLTTGKLFKRRFTAQLKISILSSQLAEQVSGKRITWSQPFEQPMRSRFGSSQSSLAGLWDLERLALVSASLYLEIPLRSSFARFSMYGL